MELLIEILKIILPAIITGIFSFFVARYNYGKNVPLDKMEIAYDKIYFPIYKMTNGKIFKNIANKTNNLDRLLHEISSILNENSKYADKSTLKSFDMFYKNKDKETYVNFKNNIINKHSYLRRRLGYLEPNIFQTYKYSSKVDKYAFRILIESLVLYIIIILYSLSNGKRQAILFLIALIGITVLVLELAIFLFIIINPVIKILYKYIKSKFKK